MKFSQNRCLNVPSSIFGSSARFEYYIFIIVEALFQLKKKKIRKKYYCLTIVHSSPRREFKSVIGGQEGDPCRTSTDHSRTIVVQRTEGYFFYYFTIINYHRFWRELRTKDTHSQSSSERRPEKTCRTKQCGPPMTTIIIIFIMYWV